jgi:4-amino-4-deoxy-L-arabinose transferase-like glycosyltransferase
VRNRRVQWAGLAAVLALAAVLRIYDLENVPAGLYCDEAGNGYNAYALGTAGIDENGRSWPLYIWSFGTSYKNPAFIYPAILPIKLFGLSGFSVRLTAALFGIGTVAAMFFLGRALVGPWVGLWAALFLAICPWHLHFSRIAFELIAFPFLFVSGCAALVRFTQGRRMLPVALGLFAACVYAYAPAALFVPAFLVGFGLLYLPDLVRRWRELLLALIVAGAVLAPAAVFFVRQTGTGTVYFRRTTFVDPAEPWRPQLERFANNYRQFFAERFLLREGDPIFRHSVRDFGELYPFFVPFILLGAGTALLRRDRASKLVLWWTALYPVAPSLMNEIPSATRGIIGAPAFCLLAGLGFAASLRALRWLVGGRRWGVVLQAAAVVAAGVVLVPEVWSYLQAYFVRYPTYAALTPGAFQYGYRDAIQYMESQRGKYDLLLLSATDTNQPQVFAQFYRPVDPRDWAARHDVGYLIAKPEEYAHFTPGQRVLAALHPDDVDLFSDLDIKRVIEAPGGKVAFVIAEIKARKQYLQNWLVLGLFPNDDLRGDRRDFVDPHDLAPRPYRGAFGQVAWTPARQQIASVDLNRIYAAADPRTPGNPEHVCAYAATTVHAAAGGAAMLEVSGSLNDTLRAWWNGRLLTPFPLMMGAEPRYRPIELQAGDNGLLVQSCEDIGTWSFSARITDAQGRDIPGITTVAALPTELMRAAPDADAVQLVEGFTESQGGAFDPHYPDQRGGGPSWRARVSEHSSVTWATAPPTSALPAVFAFTGSTSDEQGDFKLFVDGAYALTFQSERDREMHTWSENGYTLVFISRTSAAGNAGFYLLSVPADRVHAGQPLTLRVEGAAGDPAAWFMIKGYGDTIAHEHVSPDMAAESTHGAWRTRHLPFIAAQ